MGDALAAFFGIVLGLALALILLVVITLIFRWLWNTTIPEVFGPKTVTFWQALEIPILASLLFGGPRVIERQVEVENVEIGTPA